MSTLQKPYFLAGCNSLILRGDSERFVSFQKQVFLDGRSVVDLQKVEEAESEVFTEGYGFGAGVAHGERAANRRRASL